MFFLGAPLMPLIIFLVVMIGTILYSYFEGKDLSALTFRKKQADTFANENLLKVKIREYTEKKIDYSKRYKIETLCLQAGLNWSYTDYVIVCGLFSIGLFLLFSVLMQNPLMGIIFSIVALFVPKQVITFIKNRRFGILERQIGPFMNMVIKRYENTRDFQRALVLTMEEFRGTQPMFGELQKTVAEIQVGVSIGDAMDNLARRTGNIYLARLSDYYKIASTLGTEEVRRKLLRQAYEQFEENRKMKEFLKKEISEPVKDSYIMVSTIPAFFLFGTFTMQGYLEFMLRDPIGKLGMAVIVSVIIGAIWFINARIAAPLN